MLVHGFLEASSEKYPGKTALVAGGERYTYADVDAMASRVAAALEASGFRRGDRAVVFLDNSLEAVVSLFGVLKAGGVFVMVNPSMKAEKLAWILDNCRAFALFGPASRHALAAEAAGKSAHLKRIFLAGRINSRAPLEDKRTASLDEAIRGAGAPVAGAATTESDLATIIYTSGSTGTPKGVMMAHGNMAAAASSITEYLENTADDIILNTLPVSFDYGLYQVLMAFMTGATVILERSFLYPYRTLETMLKEKVTGFPIVPTMAAILLKMDDIKKMSFPALRYLTNTAAALPVAHITKLRELFPGAALYSMYGLTECKRVSYLPPAELDRRPASVGRAMPRTEAFVVDENGVRVGPGVVGELVVRGPHVMRGYWEMPEATARVLRPGARPGETVLHTGDLFRSDDEGFLYFVGRTDEIIKSRGEKVSPREIENVLCSIEGVVEAAVVGVPDPLLGQAIKAFVVKREDAAMAERDVLRFCAARLEDYMVPRAIEFVGELPTTDSGKVRKVSLS